MSINSALVDLRVPAEVTLAERGTKAIAVIGRLVGRPRWPQPRPYLNVGDSYRIPGGRRGYECGSNWVHTHH